MSENVAIKIEELTKIYKDFERKQEITAIANLSIEIYKGEILGIHGPDGAGKTTLARLLSGQDIPTNGSITIRGKSPTDPKVKPRIGALPEKSFAMRFSNAEEALRFLGRSSSIPREQRKRWMSQLLALFGLDKVRKSPIKGFSENMLRKLNLALALINNPDCVVLDEPLEGLDPSGIKEIKDILKDLKGRGKTIVIFTSAVENIQDICDRTLLLEKEQLQPAAPAVTAPPPVTVTPPEAEEDKIPAVVMEEVRVREEPVEEAISRRSFFAATASILMGIISACVGVPLVVYAIVPALRREAAKWVEIGDVDGFTVGAPLKTTTTVVVKDGWATVKKSQNLFVVKDEGGQFVIFSDRCTHLGCAVRWEGDKNRFLCPCHNGVFDRNGRVVAGPPPEPLRRLDYKIAGGKLLVSIV